MNDIPSDMPMVRSVVGSLLTWRKPSIRLRSGESSRACILSGAEYGVRILITRSPRKQEENTLNEKVDARTHVCDDQTADCRPKCPHEVERQRDERRRVHQRLARHGVRHQHLTHRVVPGPQQPEQKRENVQVPHLLQVEEEKRRKPEHQYGNQRLIYQQQFASVETVGDDARDRREQQRQRAYADNARHVQRAARKVIRKPAERHLLKPHAPSHQACRHSEDAEIRIAQRQRRFAAT